MLKRVRPNRLFSLLDVEGPERVATVRLSKRRGLAMKTNDDTVCVSGAADFSLMYLETMVIIAVLKLIQAHRVFEFGTHLGSTTLNLALNLPESGRVYTMDLIRGDRFKEWSYFERESHKIVSIPDQDSSEFDFSIFEKDPFDFIWIDGNPDRSDDTRNAFRILNGDKLSCIGWHDYLHPDANTTETVEQLAETKTIYHVEDTAVCLHFNREVDL